jgi:hypothetical protein
MTMARCPLDDYQVQEIIPNLQIFSGKSFVFMTALKKLLTNA